MSVGGSSVTWRWLAPLLAGAALACGAPDAKEHPTWSDVQPILAGQCLSCHGSTASKNGGGFRFDFYDMKKETCGDAVVALGEDAPLGAARAPEIINAIASGSSPVSARPLMPPPPAPYLETWQWTTLQRWWKDGVPRGDLPASNRPARVDLFRGASTADVGLDVTALLSDPDGDPVVGVLKVGDETLPMDRAGSFSAHLDTATWAPGSYPITAVLCDGWSQVSYAISTLEVAHAR